MFIYCEYIHIWPVGHTKKKKKKKLHFCCWCNFEAPSAWHFHKVSEIRSLIWAEKTDSFPAIGHVSQCKRVGLPNSYLVYFLISALRLQECQGCNYKKKSTQAWGGRKLSWILKIWRLKMKTCDQNVEEDQESLDIWCLLITVIKCFKSHNPFAVAGTLVREEPSGWVESSRLPCYVFFSCHSSIGDLVTDWLTEWLSEPLLFFLTLKSDPRDLWPLRHWWQFLMTIVDENCWW